jgi:RNA polymerase sigma-70 factor, ECF subfamily
MLPVRDPVPSTVADLAALGQLWEQHRGRLLAMLERRIDSRLRQRLDPEEVLNEAFLDASREWPDYQRGSPMQPYAWLYQITFDRLIEVYRRHATAGRDLRRDIPWPDDCSAVLGGQLMDAGTGPLTAAQRLEMIERVQSVLELSPETDRDILAMRYFDQLSTREICDVLNARQPNSAPTSEDTLNVRMFRALKKLQKLWQQTYGEPESSIGS